VPRGRSREDMADMQRRRGPFSDPRQGRLLSEIEWAFKLKKVEILPTTVLLEFCYGGRTIRKLSGSPAWHREMVKRAALKICTPVGRSRKGSGRPMLWKADPERMKLRSRIGKINRRRARQGLPPLEDL
jgi:hypothetical protein